MSESDYQRGLRGAEYNGSISDFERWNDWKTGRDERERLQDISDEALIMQTLTPAEQIARIDARVAARKAKEVAEEIARLERRVHERERSHNDEVKGLFLTAVFLLFLLVTYLFPFKTDSGPGGRLFAWCGGCLLLSLYFWWTAARRVRFPLGSNVSRQNVNSPDKGEAKPQPKVFGILVVTLFSILFWLGFELKSGRLNLDANSPEVMRQILFGRPFSGIQLQAVNPLDEYSTSKHAIVVRDVSMVYAIRQETPTGGAERRRTRKTAGPSAIPNRTETAYGSGGDFTRCGSGIQRWSHRALPGSEPQHRRAVRAEVSAFWPAGCLGRVA